MIVKSTLRIRFHLGLPNKSHLPFYIYSDQVYDMSLTYYTEKITLKLMGDVRNYYVPANMAG